MTCPTPADVHPAARALIPDHVGHLVGRFGFTRDDADDLAQELALQAHVAAARFDPSRSDGFRYYDRVLANKVRSIIAGARCRKRDRRRERPLNDQRVILDWDVADRLALAIDVADALAPLTPGDREVAELLATDTVAGVARWTGSTRGKIRAAKARIARALAAKNLAPNSQDEQPFPAATRYVLVDGKSDHRNSRPTGRKAKVVGVRSPGRHAGAQPAAAEGAP